MKFNPIFFNDDDKNKDIIADLLKKTNLSLEDVRFDRLYLQYKKNF